MISAVKKPKETKRKYKGKLRTKSIDKSLAYLFMQSGNPEEYTTAL